MRVGDTCMFEGTSYTDEVAGRTVRRLTPLDCYSHHQYFYFNMWTSDSRCVLITSNRGDGIRRTYLVDVESGEGLCLTDDEELAPMFGEIARDDSHLLYSAAGELRRRDMSSLDEEVLYTCERPWKGRAYYGATADHTHAVLVEMHEEDNMRGGRGWEFFRPQFEKHPRCRLVEVDLITKKHRVILEDACWFGHPNYSPDGKHIMFCHEGPWNLVDSRIWFIDPDGGNLREGRKRNPEHPAGSEGAELWGHEFWLPDSSRAAYIYFPEKYGKNATVRLLDPMTLDEEVLMDVSGYSHFISDRDFAMLVGDGHDSDSLYLVDVTSKTEASLCRHGTSWEPYVDPHSGKSNTQAAHPHPCFSPDGTRVVFSSDMHGAPAAYVVTI